MNRTIIRILNPLIKASPNINFIRAFSFKKKTNNAPVIYDQGRHRMIDEDANVLNYKDHDVVNMIGEKNYREMLISATRNASALLATQQTSSAENLGRVTPGAIHESLRRIKAVDPKQRRAKLVELFTTVCRLDMPEIPKSGLAWVCFIFASMMFISIAFTGYIRSNPSREVIGWWKMEQIPSKANNEWEQEYERFKQSPYYTETNGTTLTQFKILYTVEFIRRSFNSRMLLFTSCMSLIVGIKSGIKSSLFRLSLLTVLFSAILKVSDIKYPFWNNLTNVKDNVKDMYKQVDEKNIQRNLDRNALIITSVMKEEQEKQKSLDSPTPSDTLDSSVNKVMKDTEPVLPPVSKSPSTPSNSPENTNTNDTINLINPALSSQIIFQTLLFTFFLITGMRASRGRISTFLAQSDKAVDCSKFVLNYFPVKVTTATTHSAILTLVIGALNAGNILNEKVPGMINDSIIDGTHNSTLLHMFFGILTSGLAILTAIKSHNPTSLNLINRNGTFVGMAGGLQLATGLMAPVIGPGTSLILHHTSAAVLFGTLAQLKFLNSNPVFAMGNIHSEVLKKRLQINEERTIDRKERFKEILMEKEKLKEKKKKKIVK